jgi:non-heme chloroperoxidase
MDRRDLLQALAVVAGDGVVRAAPEAAAAAPAQKQPIIKPQIRRRSFFVTPDGTSLFYKDWGSGPPVLFVPPWALNSDWWEYQIAYLTGQGLRCISYDRRGHGRSDEPGEGYNFDTLADDLATLIEQLDLHDITLVGHSMGAGEVVRYLSRHRAERVSRAVLVATITPFTLRTPDNPDGVERRGLEKGRLDLSRDRPHQLAIAAPAFFGTDKNSVSSEIMDWWVRMMLDRCSLKVMLDLHREFTETDFRPDLRAITVPVQLIHGDIDTSTPLEFTSHRTAQLIPSCRLTVYENAAHALPITHADRLNADLLALVKGSSRT